MAKTTLPDPRVSPRFAGICTFCRYPRLEDVPGADGPPDWLLYGAPYDGGVTYRPGARFGPRAVREASQYVKRFHVEHGVDVCSVLGMADAGDAPVKPYDPKECVDAIAGWAAALGDPSPAPAKLLAVGGDHSIAYANIRATWERRGRPKGGLALVHFDAHLDTVDAVWGEKWGHASVFVRAIEDGLIDPRAMLSAGLRGPLNAASDLDFAASRGVRLITMDAWRARGNAELAAFVTSLAGREVYLTFDIDAVDPAFAPGTGTLCPGGFSAAEALGALRALRGIRLAGADVVEVLPDRDPAGITSMLAAHIVFEILALDAAARAGAATA